MNPSAASKGSSFAGAVGYITHDVGKSSAERVVFTDVLNMRTDDPAKAAKVMAWTALHAAQLKEAAGLKATGRKTTSPVYHFSLNWEPGEQVSHTDMLAAAKSSLAALGYENHEAVLAVHRDKPHQHIHVVVNRIHPETGKTHNPNNDYEALQRWAYQYEKDRGRVVCLERAIKYEKDQALKAEYTKRLAAELDAGKKRDSKPRPQWEAEQDATHPKSERYRALKAKFAERVKALAKRGRELAARKATEWESLEFRHAEEKAALWEKQQAAFKNRRAFQKASQPEAYSWKAFQEDRAALRKRQTVQVQQFRTSLKAQDESTVARFKASQKTAWAQFYAAQRDKAGDQPDRALKPVTSTRVGLHGPEHRNCMAAVFNAKSADPETEKVKFAASLDAQKRAFYGALAERIASALTPLKSEQTAELKALRDRFEASREALKTRAAGITRAKAGEKAERTALAKSHRIERAATKARHAEETEELRKDWAELNADRAKAWDDYKQLRQAQMQNPGSGGRSADREHLVKAFKPHEHRKGLDRDR